MEILAVNPQSITTPGRNLSLSLALVLVAGMAASAQQPVPTDDKAQQQQQAEAKADAAKKAFAANAANAATSKADAIKAAMGATTTQVPANANSGGQNNGRATAQPGGAGSSGGAPRVPGQAPGGLKVEGAGTGTGGSGAARTLGPDEATLPGGSDALDLKTLVEYVAETLQINIAGNDTLTGSVVLNAPVTVKKSELLKLLNSLLEQQDFMITKDDTGWYKVIPTSGVLYTTMPGDLATTRVIPTPTVKPSSLATAINEQLGTQTHSARLSFLDELGVIVATDSPRRLDALDSLIHGILERNSDMDFTLFDLQYVAPTVARQRLIDLLGQQTGTTLGGGIQLPVNAGQPQQQAGAGQPTGNITNIADRLVADPTSSALYFRGYPEETARVRQLLTIIDRKNTLHYEQYNAGSGAVDIAQLAERLGLGHVEIVQASNTPQTNQPGVQQFTNFQQPGNNRNQQPNILQTSQQQSNANIGGPVMIVDTARYVIIYYGTDAQHEQLHDLISKFDTDREQVVIVTYKLKNKPADVVSDTLNSIAFNQSSGSSNSSFLPGGFNPFFPNLNNSNTNNRTNSTSGSRTSTTSSGSSRTTSGSTTSSQNRTNQQRTTGNNGFRNLPGGASQQASADTNDPLGGPEVFILADTANNQVIVKAPARQQEEFAKVIAKLDQRSPQVCVEVQIVAVTANDDFRLAFETQLQAGQFNANTNFGLGTLSQTTPGAGGTTTTTGGFTSPKQVATNLSGFTSAVIKSQYVPLVMTALKNNTDTRIVAAPFILVDDNVEAEIVALDEQPTSSQVINASTTSTNFNGYEQAGTRLTVTPSISEGGYLRLMYEIELSNFVGSGTADLPPPKQTRNVRSDSVTIPGDATIVVGGIKFNQASSTIAKIPLIGNIPLLGYLFRDTNTSNQNTRLYVFITPRIFRDANFRDPILYTMGPRADAGIEADYPELKPALIEMLGGGEARPAEPSTETAPLAEKKKKPENHRLWPDPHAE